MNRSFPSSDDDHQTTPRVSSEPPAFRVALIDLTTSQVIISIGEPPMESSEDAAEHGAARRTEAPTPTPRRCARGLVRRGGQTVARRFGDGSACA